MKKIIALVILISFLSCSPKLFKEKWTKEEAPAYFKARFETTQGNFDIEAKRVDRKKKDPAKENKEEKKLATA